MYFFQAWSLAVQVSQQDSSPAHWTTAMEHLDLRNVRLTGWGVGNVGNWKRKSMLEAIFCCPHCFPTEWEQGARTDRVYRSSYSTVRRCILCWVKTTKVFGDIWYGCEKHVRLQSQLGTLQDSGLGFVTQNCRCQIFAVRATHLCSLGSAGSWLHRVWFLLGSIVSKCLKFLKWVCLKIVCP